MYQVEVRYSGLDLWCVLGQFPTREGAEIYLFEYLSKENYQVVASKIVKAK